jgi:hypothetical protein
LCCDGGGVDGYGDFVEEFDDTGLRRFKIGEERSHFWV